MRHSPRFRARQHQSHKWPTLSGGRKRHPLYLAQMRGIFERITHGPIRASTSVLTLTEVLHNNGAVMLYTPFRHVSERRATGESPHQYMLDGCLGRSGCCRRPSPALLRWRCNNLEGLDRLLHVIIPPLWSALRTLDASLHSWVATQVRALPWHWKHHATLSASLPLLHRRTGAQ